MSGWKTGACSLRPLAQALGLYQRARSLVNITECSKVTPTLLRLGDQNPDSTGREDGKGLLLSATQEPAGAGVGSAAVFSDRIQHSGVSELKNKLPANTSEQGLGGCV